MKFRGKPVPKHIRAPRYTLKLAGENDLGDYGLPVMQEFASAIAKEIAIAEDDLFMKQLAEAWGDLCTHCMQKLEEHGNDGKCLYGPSYYRDFLGLMYGEKRQAVP